MYTIKKFTYWLITWPAILAFILMRGDSKERLKKDLSRFYCRHRRVSGQCGIKAFYIMIVSRKEFRNVFYMRLSYLSILIKWLLPGMPTLEFGSKSRQIEGGLFIEHGWSMVIEAEHVGKNLWINQGVTIGYGRNGHPTIGDNVRIGTGAIVLGGITIGDNVNIGANAIIVEDVPSNCTICSPKATIVKRHDEPTMNARMGGGNKPLITRNLAA